VHLAAVPAEQERDAARPVERLAADDVGRAPEVVADRDRGEAERLGARGLAREDTEVAIEAVDAEFRSAWHQR
jgi:hypothetical protein